MPFLFVKAGHPPFMAHKLFTWVDFRRGVLGHRVQSIEQVLKLNRLRCLGLTDCRWIPLPEAGKGWKIGDGNQSTA